MRAAAAVLALVLAGCGTAARPIPSASVDTASPGWDRSFQVAWRVEPKGGADDLYGFVYNEDHRAAVNVRVLAQAFDDAGNVVAQKLERVSGMVPAHDRAYFRIESLPPAPRYRVSVWSYEFREIPAWRTR